MSEIFRLQQPFKSSRNISQGFLQAGKCLNLYQAELARILKCQCNDITQIAAGRQLLQPATRAYHNAVYFILIYQNLYQYYHGNAVRMYRWLHHDSGQLPMSPFLMLVDQQKIIEVADFLAKTIQCRQVHKSRH